MVTSLFSQVNYPTDSSYISTLSQGDKLNFRQFSYSKIDSAITHFQNYYPRNTNGNLGLPSAPLTINYVVRPLGFVMYRAPYGYDVISDDQVKYHQTKGPYASLTGIAGTRQEQLFKLLFSHTFKNKLNVTLAFNRYSGLGFYKRQQSFTNNFYTSSNYTSENGRVGYYGYFLFNRLKHQENGGIKNDSLFQVSVTVTKLLLPVNLNNARRDYRTTSAVVNPWFRLNKIEDSSTVISQYVDYQLSYSGNYTKYVDSGDTLDKFYPRSYLDTVQTFDSTHWRTVSNAFNYTVKFIPLNARLQVGLKNEYNQVYQHQDSSFMNNSFNAGFFITKNNYSGSAKLSYLFQGANSNDYSLEINNRVTQKIAYDFFKIPFVFLLNAQVEKRHPDFIHNTWYTNHFVWRNNFSPIDQQQLMGSISTIDNRFEMGVVYQNLKNYVFFDQQALPEQTPVAIQNISFFIRKDILLFKHLGLNGGYNYQGTSNATIINIPNHLVSGALYFQGNYKDALQLQVGFSGNYYSEFKGYKYMPATNMYYTQTQTTVGGYPYIDFFLNARVRPVKFFIKIDHVFQGFLGRGYSLVPGYLQNDRAFKFGLNWLFFD